LAPQGYFHFSNSFVIRKIGQRRQPGNWFEGSNPSLRRSLKRSFNGDSKIPEYIARNKVSTIRRVYRNCKFRNTKQFAFSFFFV